MWSRVIIPFLIAFAISFALGQAYGQRTGGSFGGRAVSFSAPRVSIPAPRVSVPVYRPSFTYRPAPVYRPTVTYRPAPSRPYYRPRPSSPSPVIVVVNRTNHYHQHGRDHRDAGRDIDAGLPPVESDGCSARPGKAARPLALLALVLAVLACSLRRRGV